MKVTDDVQLIQNILSGDDEAFTALVRKHQKSVHALAWQRVGDFHFAEEITQDVFLRVYKHLPKLQDPRRFSGWLYVIVDRCCNSWPKDNTSEIESVEDVPIVEIQKTSYDRYISEQREIEARVHHYELVEKLLKKLPVRESSIMKFYYLDEMTAKEIGELLSVSVNTVTSYLQRGRKRLKNLVGGGRTLIFRVFFLKRHFPIFQIFTLMKGGNFHVKDV